MPTSEQPVAPLQQIVMEDRGTVQRLILEQLKSLREEQTKGFDSMRSEFNSRLDRLVTQDAFTAEQRRVDGRFTELAKDIADERSSRLSSETAAEKRGDKLAANIRWMAAAIILPIALFAANLWVGRGGA